jgi:hypothetical protein
MIEFDPIAWDDEDDPRGNVQHIAANVLRIHFAGPNSGWDTDTSVR